MATNQASPWSSATSLSHWRECNELHFISSLPPGGMQLITASADFIRHFPPMSAVGARQHPQQRPLLSGSGAVAAIQAAAAERAAAAGQDDPAAVCSVQGMPESSDGKTQSPELEYSGTQ